MCVGREHYPDVFKARATRAAKSTSNVSSGPEESADPTVATDDMDADMQEAGAELQELMSSAVKGNKSKPAKSKMPGARRAQLKRQGKWMLADVMCARQWTTQPAEGHLSAQFSSYDHPAGLEVGGVCLMQQCTEQPALMLWQPGVHARVTDM